jgi:hypothetical protein
LAKRALTDRIFLLGKFLLRHGRRPPTGPKTRSLKHLTWVRQEVNLDRAIEEVVKSAAIIACAVPINNSRISHLPDSCNLVTHPSCILLILKSHGVFADHSPYVHPLNVADFKGIRAG